MIMASVRENGNANLCLPNSRGPAPKHTVPLPLNNYNCQNGFYLKEFKIGLSIIFTQIRVFLVFAIDHHIENDGYHVPSLVSCNLGDGLLKESVEIWAFQGNPGSYSLGHFHTTPDLELKNTFDH